MNFSLENLIQKLSQATYDPSIGITDVVLEEIAVRGEKLRQLLVKLDPGKELVPHLHEKDDEVGTILTSGTMYFGDAKKEGDHYLLDNEGKIVIEWGTPMQYTSGETFTIPAGKAHHFVAGDAEPFLLLITLPATHITGEDRKFTTHP